MIIHSKPSTIYHARATLLGKTGMMLRAQNLPVKILKTWKQCSEMPPHCSGHHWLRAFIYQSPRNVRGSGLSKAYGGGLGRTLLITKKVTVSPYEV